MDREFVITKLSLSIFVLKRHYKDFWLCFVNLAPRLVSYFDVLYLRFFHLKSIEVNNCIRFMAWRSNREFLGRLKLQRSC